MFDYKEEAEFNRHKYDEYVRTQDAKLKEYDRVANILFVVGTGTLVISFSFTTNYKDTYLILPGLLIVAWLLLIASIILMVVVRKKAISLYTELCVWISGWKINAPEKGLPPHLQEVMKQVDRGENVVVCMLVVGLMSLLVFASANFITINRNNDVQRSHDNAYRQR
jgi:hypothetical protein